MNREKSGTYGSNEVEEFDDGRVEDVVAVGVRAQRVDERLEQVGLDDVLVERLLFEAERLAQKPESG